MATFVLMHGGGMGGWVWKYLTPLLRKQGHEVYTPTFTGFGERIHLIGRNITNATHVADIVNVLNFEDLNDCIMVSHSYAGAVQPGIDAAVGMRIRRYVFVDAFVMRAGESVTEAVGFMSKEQAEDMAAMLAKGEGPVGTGVAEMQREMARQDPFWMPADRQNWLLDHLSDMPMACMVSPIAVGAESIKKPVDYIAVSHTVMAPMHPRARALGWKMHEIKGDHAIIVGEPNTIADLLLGLV